MDINESILILKALADESRLMIVNLLAEKNGYVEEIAEQLNLAPSTVSFHLKKLEQAGLICKTKNQYYSEFSLNNQIFESKLIDLLHCEIANKVEQAQRLVNYKDKVLQTFINDGKILQMPTQLKKRLLVLEWIYEKIEFEKFYSEEEISDLIKNYFEDYCLIRRELVDFKYLQRSDNIYKKMKME